MTAPVFAILTAVFLAAVLISEWRKNRTGVAIFKPLTSTVFVVFGVLCTVGMDDVTYGALITAGLVLSWWGDVLLIPQDKPKIFQLGVLAFGLAHVAYCAAFVVAGLDLVAVGVAAAPMAVAAGVVWRWLSAHLPDAMRGQVMAYVGVITVMVALSVGAAVHTGVPLIAVGAFVFYLSDLSVARERFVTQSFVNRLWGLPFYYAAQIMLGITILSVR